MYEKWVSGKLLGSCFLTEKKVSPGENMVFLCWSDDIGGVAATAYVRVCVRERGVSQWTFGTVSLLPCLLLPLQYTRVICTFQISAPVW